MATQSISPLIIGFVSDLFFTVKIDSAAEKLNYRVHWIERPDQLPPGMFQYGDEASPVHPVEFGDALLDQVTRLHPALIILDLGNDQIPWRSWIPLLKSSPATRRIPLICYGSHVDGQTMKAARSAGADSVLARSKFVADLPKLIETYARHPDYAALEEACQDTLLPIGIKGLQEFNQGLFFEAHEHLEEAWNEDQTAGRDLYRAILQVAVAYLQIERGNYPGAMKIFLRLRQWIDPLPDRCRGIDIARLREDALLVQNTLAGLGPARIHELDRNLFRPVVYEL
jgi:predicted metal-dependent hydrolase